MEQWVETHYYTLLALEAGYRVVWYTAAAIVIPVFGVKVVLELREIRRRLVPTFLHQEAAGRRSDENHAAIRSFPPRRSAS